MERMKTLQQSSVFNSLNMNNRVTTIIGEILDKGDTVKPSELEQAFVTMKMYKYPLRPAVIEAVNSGRIVMKFPPPNLKLTRAMPFFLNKGPDNVVRAIIMLDHYGTRDRDGMYNVDAKKLYTILESAYLSIVYTNSYKSIPSKTGIIKHGSVIYANMFARVLSRKYALSTDKIKLHKVQFLASKFFLLNVLGAKDSESITNYALANCVGGNAIILREVNEIVEEKDYINLETFILALKKPELNLNFGDSLTTRSFIEQYILMYDQSALLALEMFPYFTMTVNAVTNGAYINNQLILEDIVDKVGVKYYQEMLNLSRA